MIVYSDKTVYQALYDRIIAAFKNNVSIYLSFSGGKDSLTMAHAIVELIEARKINPKLLTVIFIDEEGMYPCIIEVVKKWRTKFMLLGAKFIWLCMEFKHFNCFNTLRDDDSFILWDRTKKDVWIRPMPEFAVTSHPAFTPGKNTTYQDFMSKINDGIQLIGVRVSESVQRRGNLAKSTSGKGVRSTCVYPIYDWSTDDIFLYIRQKKIELPAIYKYMWESGVSKNNLRVSAFFSVDAAKSLVQMMEYYPELYERIIAREPNAVMAMYYWDSEMFRRSSAKRRKLEGEVVVDNKKKLFELLKNPMYSDSKESQKIKIILQRNSILMTDVLYRDMCNIIIGGDPKSRAIRALYSEIGIYYSGGKR